MKLLHVGCGGQKAPLSGYEEIGLDLDPKSGADLIGSMLDIPLEDGSVDGVYTSHTLEHVTLHDGVRALKEFVRVLKPGGQCIVIVPNKNEGMRVQCVILSPPSHSAFQLPKLPTGTLLVHC